MALSQIAAPGIRCVLVVMLAGLDCGFDVDVEFLESVTQIKASRTLDGTFYLSFRTNRRPLFLVESLGNKTGNWELRYFFVKKNRHSVPASADGMRADWALAGEE